MSHPPGAARKATASRNKLFQQQPSIPKAARKEHGRRFAPDWSLTWFSIPKGSAMAAKPSKCFKRSPSGNCVTSSSASAVCSVWFPGSWTLLASSLKSLAASRKVCGMSRRVLERFSDYITWDYKFGGHAVHVYKMKIYA